MSKKRGAIRHGYESTCRSRSRMLRFIEKAKILIIESHTAALVFDTTHDLLMYFSTKMKPGEMISLSTFNKLITDNSYYLKHATLANIFKEEWAEFMVWYKAYKLQKAQIMAEDIANCSDSKTQGDWKRLAWLLKCRMRSTFSETTSEDKENKTPQEIKITIAKD